MKWLPERERRGMRIVVYQKSGTTGSVEWLKGRRKERERERGSDEGSRFLLLTRGKECVVFRIGRTIGAGGKWRCVTEGQNPERIGCKNSRGRERVMCRGREGSENVSPSI